MKVVVISPDGKTTTSETGRALEIAGLTSWELVSSVNELRALSGAGGHDFWLLVRNGFRVSPDLKYALTSTLQGQAVKQITCGLFKVDVGGLNEWAQINPAAVRPSVSYMFASCALVSAELAQVALGGRPESLFHWYLEIERRANSGELLPVAFGRSSANSHPFSERTTPAPAATTDHLLPSLSVVVPTRGDESRTLSRLLRDLCTLAESGFDVEVICVTSHTESLNLRSQTLNSDLRLLHHQVNTPFNFSHSCNEGAAAAKGDILLFVNDDVQLPTHDLIREMIRTLTDGSIGAVGARLLYPDGKLQHVGIAASDRDVWHPWRGHDPKQLAPWLWQDDFDSLAVTAAVLGVTRGVFKDVGGFDLEFPLAFGDVEFCTRLWSRGLRVRQLNASYAHHLESQSRDPGVSRENVEILCSTVLPKMRELHGQVDLNQQFINSRSPWLKARNSQEYGYGKRVNFALRHLCKTVLGRR